ncbi:DUF3667 domain-containing protein [Flavobacterium sp.]|uniref:DUF3667 domain-containing protein n=1 Tax=Flavobacterium sp. TaxID=239 RepID=UPI002B4AFB9E|nr:DUF3667 domain-containing protein [Flavobacterium sp.]HLP63646.1 DUF3667 domain-containing protein [Flavobacterium sp.]
MSETLETLEPIEKTCPNCSAVIIDNFCSSCGQKKYKRIDRKYVIDELQYTLLHTNKGLFYSIKKILRNPGKTAREFIEGNRVNHYKPVLLVFILSGISTFISYKILGITEVMTAYYKSKHMDLNAQLNADVMSFLASYNSIIMLILVPLFAITTKLAFRKWGQNYYEHVVMNCFILSCYTLVSMILIFPFLFLYRNSPDTFFLISQLSLVLIPIIIFWFFKGFYSNHPTKSIIFRTFGILGLTLLGYILLIIVFSIGFGIYMALINPEALKQFAPKK